MVVALPNLASGHAMHLGVETDEACHPLELSLKSLVRCEYYYQSLEAYIQCRKWLELLHCCTKIENSMVCTSKDVQGRGTPAIWKL